MNRKAQMNIIGMVITTFIGVIVALAIFSGGIVPEVGEATELDSFNTSSGGDALTVTSSTFTNLNGKVVTGFEALNTSNGVVIDSGNYTIENNQIIDGILTARINTSAAGGDASGPTWNVSYTYEDVGYLSSSADRTIINLVLIFAALAIMIGAVVLAVHNLKQFR